MYISDLEVMLSRLANGCSYCTVTIPALRKLHLYQYRIIKLKMKLNQKNIEEHLLLRAWLLPMLMNGQVKVGEMKEYAQAAEPKPTYKTENQE